MLRLIVTLAVLALALALGGCPPTLSKSRPSAHLESMADGDRHVHHGRYDDASSAYAAAADNAERRVDRDEARYRQARVLRKQGRFEEAVELLDAIAAVEPPSRRTARAVYDAARIREDHLGRQAEALPAYDRILSEWPDEGLGARALFFRLAAIEGAQAKIAFLDGLYPELREAELADDLLMAKVDLQLEAGDRAGARQTLEQITRDHFYPQGHRWDDAVFKLADMDVEDGKPEEAIARLERMLERHDTTNIIGSYTLSAFPQAQLRIARLYRDVVGDHDRAASAFKRVGRKFPRSTLRDDAAYELGVMLIEDGEVGDGCDVLREVVEDFEVGHARRLAGRRIAESCG